MSHIVTLSLLIPLRCSPELLPDAIFRIHLKESRKYLPDPILGFESFDVFGLLQKTVDGECEPPLSLRSLSGTQYSCILLVWLPLTCSTSKTAECSIHLSFKAPNALARLNFVADMALSSIGKYNDSGVDVNNAVDNLVRVVEETIAINAVDTGVKVSTPTLKKIQVSSLSLISCIIIE